MKARTTNKHVPWSKPLYLRTPVLSQVPEVLRRSVEAAYASHGGVEFMKLRDWRDLELELNRKLKNEAQQRQR